ncbi:MAG: YitT family protein [Muribaculaceae bacterium]|nr:YitT family protein [Muribaculaceae bacterium]
MSMLINGKKLWMTTKDYVIITLAICCYGLGFSAFILPEKVVIGGVTGLGTIVYFLTGKTWAIGATQYVINLGLLAAAWFIVGKQFVAKTIFGATVVSVVVTVFPPLFPEPLVAGQSFMNVCIGSIICGISLGLVFTHNGSTGGTDVVAAMVAKKTNVTIGRTMLYVDFCIISSSYFIFHQFDTVVYGFMVLIISSYVVDLIINTNRQAVQFIIISQKWEPIATAVNHHARRGVTVMDGMGWYTKQPIKILLIVCRKIESVTIFRIIKSIDPGAFITQANVNGVYGQGFDELKFKQDLKLREELEHEAEEVMEERGRS